MRALDLGCGTGLFTKELLSKIYHQIDLVDATPEAVNEAVKCNSENGTKKSYLGYHFATEV